MIHKKLLNWYKKNQRDLPWRKTDDPYRIWVSEVMLQQTRVATVIPYYERFIRRFPEPESLGAADLQEVLKIWEGLGYYARARNLHRAAGIVREEHGGIIPSDYQGFLRLPGVGEYIAAAVLSIAFGKPYAVLDGNVKRVLARLFVMPEAVNDSAKHKIFKKQADDLLDMSRPADYNQAVMELGALVCVPRNPECTACPLPEHCRAFREGKTAEYPKRKAAKSVPTYRIAAAILFHNEKMLIVRRPEKGLLGGLWEFPGGKVKKGERAQAACIREIREKTALRAEVQSYLCRVKHAYTHFKIEMDVFLCAYISGAVLLKGPADYRWVRKAEIRDYPFPKSHLKALARLFSAD
ncbi:MAG: A/G-specific adenine glycosylase [Desulfococcaceae bacterium]|jgi:A/G-specific adenine glycosylase|nr:A/G-specific adenine glycosylase [Desulfococcaceae bacterium]